MREPAADTPCAKCGGQTYDANPLTGVGTLSLSRHFLAYRGVATRCVVCGSCGYVEIYASDPEMAAERLGAEPRLEMD